MNARRLAGLFVYCGCLLGMPPVEAADPDPSITIWRRGSEPLGHADIEELARRVGYAGGRLESWEKPGSDDPSALARNESLLAMRGDKFFRQDLERNGLEMLDAIDNRATGLQAVLVRDTRGSGRVYAIMRGTEFNVGTNDERWRDAYADANTSQIGAVQYQADKARLAEWAQEHSGNLTVTGHSLGAALAQRFVLEHPNAVREAVVFNPPGLNEADCNRRTPAELPPVTYYVQPNDPVSGKGGPCHVPGKVFMVEGGSTETFTPGAKGFAEHRGYMLQDGTWVREEDFAKWQAARAKELRELWASISPASAPSDRLPGMPDQPAGPKGLATLGAAHHLIGNSQLLVSLYRQIVAARDASSAKVREVGAARYDGMVLLDEARNMAGRMRGAAENCQSAAAVRDRIVAHAEQVVKFANAADDGFQFVQAQAKACKSLEAITTALTTHDRSRALMKSASDHYGQVREGEQLLADLLGAGAQGRTTKDAANAKLAQARAMLEQMRAQANEAEALRQRAAAATAEYMRLRSATRKAFAALPSTLVAEATRQMMENWDRPEPDIVDLPGERGVAASAINAFESSLRAAEAELKGSEGMQACNSVVMPEDRIGAAAGAMVNLGLDGMGDGTREAAQECLARLRYGKTQQATGTQQRPATRSELDDLLGDVAANQADAQAARRGQQAMREADREKAGNVGGTTFREWRGEAPVDAPATPRGPNVMDGLLSSLTEAARQVQNSQAQRPPASTATHRPPVAQPGASAQQQDDRIFMIIGSALPTTHAYYRHVACRYTRSLAGPFFVSERGQEISGAVAQLRSRGHADVRVAYGPGNSGESMVREWERIMLRGEDACREAIRRERAHLEPR